MSEESNVIRNPLHDQELLNEIRDQFNLNCDVDYIFNRFVFYMNTYLNKNYTMDMLYQLINDLDDKSIMYVKSFLLKVIIKNHPDYEDIYKLYSKTILSYIVPEEEWEKIRYPQNVFFSKEFMNKQKKYDLENLYSLVAKDAGVKFLPESVIPKIKDGIIIDGGSYNGETAIVLSDYTDKKVYTFDFIKKHISLMQNKIKSCHMEEKVEIVELGISDVASSFTINNEINSTAATLVGAEESLEATAGSSLVKTTSLDDFVDDYNIEKVSLIKLDIEGFEQKAIQGMTRLLQKDKPILLISIYHHLDDFIVIKNTIEAMNLGYKFKIRHIDPLFCYNNLQKLSEDNLHPWEYMLFAYMDED